MIRHSSLPKLAECSCYESTGGSSPATERGTRMDAAFRGLLCGIQEAFDTLPDDEKPPVEWAVQEVRRLAGNEPIIAQEDQLKVKTPGMEHIGTEDSRVPTLQLSFDLKSGQIRSYREQMAAYAYGNMDRDFTQSWECVLLFCDQQETIHYTFTYDQAKAIVEGILEAVNDPEKKPTPCQYCRWCKNADKCSALGEAANDTLAVVEKQSSANLEQLRAYLADSPETLSEFYRKAVIFNDQLVDWAKNLMKEKMTAGEHVPGWKLQTSKGTEYCGMDALYEASELMSKKQIVDLFGAKIKSSELRSYCESKGIEFNYNTYRSKEVVKMVEDKPKKLK